MFPAIHLYGSDLLVAYFVRFQVLNPVPHTGIPIGRVPVAARHLHGTLPAAPFVHHAARLKSIPVQVKEHTVERIGRIVPVLNGLFALVLVCLHIHINADVVFDALLPAVGLGEEGSGKKKAKSKDFYFHGCHGCFV